MRTLLPRSIKRYVIIWKETFNSALRLYSADVRNIYERFFLFLEKNEKLKWFNDEDVIGENEVYFEARKG